MDLTLTRCWNTLWSTLHQFLPGAKTECGLQHTAYRCQNKDATRTRLLMHTWSNEQFNEKRLAMFLKEKGLDSHQNRSQHSWQFWKYRIEKTKACKRVKKANLKRITAAPAITSNANLAVPPDSTPSWQPYYTHLLLYLLLWLGTYCFKLNFWTIVQLNIPSFENSILRSFPGIKSQFQHAICCHFPSVTHFHYFIWFSIIFLIFSIFSSMNKFYDSKQWNS